MTNAVEFWMIYSASCCFSLSSFRLSSIGACAECYEKACAYRVGRVGKLDRYHEMGSFSWRTGRACRSDIDVNQVER